MNSATLRPFEAGDLRRILAIENESFGVDAWPAELFREYAADPHCCFIVAELGRTAAGYSIAVPRRGGFEIDSIAVRPSARGKGIGARLLLYAIGKARRSGAAFVSLTVRRDNAAAIALYRKFGFVRTATVPGYYEDGAAGWRMRLRLSR